MDENMLVDILVFLGLMATLGTFAKIAFSLLNRRRLPPDSTAAAIKQLSAQIDTLQHSVEAAAIEIERLGEGQRFTTKLLAERPLPNQNPPRSIP
jgi:hypothetical protein